MPAAREGPRHPFHEGRRLSYDLSAGEKLVAHGQLVPREAEGFASGLLVDALQLVHHAARQDDGRPLLDCALASAHSDLERLLGDRAVREDANPELAGALHVARDRHAGGLDLTRRDTPGLDRLHREVTERDVAPAMRGTPVVALLGLAVLGALGRKHLSSSCDLRAAIAALEHLALEDPHLDP